MTNEERDLITQFVERVGGVPAPGAASGQGTVAPLPPVDREADALIADLFNKYPEARYRVTQMAFLQEHALVEAQNRINRLQWELQQAKAQAAPASGQGGATWGTAAGAAAGAAAAQPSRGIFGNLFGGSRPAAAPPPPPQYAAPPPQYAPQYGAPPPPVYPPGYNPGLFQQQGTGFFGSALRTAAGVAGGVLAADALMSLFSSHQGFGGGFGGGGFGGGGFGGPGVVENVTINNEGQAANPWGAGADPMDAGGAPKDFDQPGQSAWSPASDQGGGWQDAPPDPGGGSQQADNAGWQDAPPDQDQGGGWDDAANAGDSGWTDSGGGGNDFSSDA